MAEQTIDIGEETVLLSEIARIGVDLVGGNDLGIRITLKSGHGFSVPSREPTKLRASVRTEWKAWLKGQVMH